jgi:hypothetical protein
VADVAADRILEEIKKAAVALARDDGATTPAGSSSTQTSSISKRQRFKAWMKKELRGAKNTTQELVDQKSIAEEIAARRAQLERAAKRFNVRA